LHPIINFKATIIIVKSKSKESAGFVET